jgi:hypothetical protein
VLRVRFDLLGAIGDEDRLLRGLKKAIDAEGHPITLSEGSFSEQAPRQFYDITLVGHPCALDLTGGTAVDLKSRTPSHRGLLSLIRSGSRVPR